MLAYRAYTPCCEHAACRARAPVKFFSHLPARCPYVHSFIPLSLTHSASTLSLLRIWRPARKLLLSIANSQLALSSSYLTSCCRTHDNNPTCAHSTPAQHRAATGAVFTMCVCAWRASALSYLLMHGRSVMLSQTAHQRVLFGVCGPPGCTSRVSGLAAACHSFHLASPCPPQPCSWPGRTHSLPLHVLAMSVVKPELGLQPDSFPAGLLWCSPGATRHLRTRPLLQVVMARGPSPSHAAWRLPAWCASPFALRPLLPRLPSTTSAGFGMASGSDLSLCLRPRLLPSVPRTPRPCTSESRWVDSGQRTHTPTNPVSECSVIAGLVALTTAASRWRHCVPFVPFAAPLCSLFPRRVTCAPFENFYFVSLNPFFV